VRGAFFLPSPPLPPCADADADGGVGREYSALVFTFLAIESVKTSGFQPNYTVVGWEIPTWSTPIIWMVLAGFLWPGSNVLGHFCGLIIGYACLPPPLMCVSMCVCGN